MKKMTLAVVVMLVFAGFQESDAQVLQHLGNKAKQKVAQRADAKADNAMEKGLDELEGKNKTKNDKEKDHKKEEAAKADPKDAVKSAKPADSTPYQTFSSKYDFVPGESIIAIEDFGNAEQGDFPTRWNTNSTAEVVTLSNKPGKWLKFNKEGVYLPEFIKNLPENFTLEFELGVNPGFAASPFVVNIGNLANIKDYTDFYHNMSWRHGHALHLQFSPTNEGRAGSASIQTGTDGNHQINNTIEFRNWDNGKSNFAHIAFWRQKNRLRVYLNGEKLFDLPRAFDAASKYNTITLATQAPNNPDDYFVISNLRMAIGAPDTRNKLLTEGKFVTRGILFDVNSDRIKPESGGALREIGNVLKENPSLKVKIVGHTDSDGDDKANLELSKKRALAVKNYLTKELGVSVANLETEGKGEAEPVDKNATAEGKANNRRVEFIRL